MFTENSPKKSKSKFSQKPKKNSNNSFDTKARAGSDKPAEREIPKIKAELFKTEQCKNWVLYGTCRYGEACKFAHGITEQRSRNRHQKYKSALCKDFPLGKCTFGIRCNFAHSISELKNPSDFNKQISTQKPSPVVSQISVINGLKSEIFGAAPLSKFNPYYNYSDSNSVLDNIAPGLDTNTRVTGTYENMNGMSKLNYLSSLKGNNILSNALNDDNNSLIQKLDYNLEQYSKQTLPRQLQAKSSFENNLHPLNNLSTQFNELNLNKFDSLKAFNNKTYENSFESRTGIMAESSMFESAISRNHELLSGFDSDSADDISSIDSLRLSLSPRTAQNNNSVSKPGSPPLLKDDFTMGYLSHLGQNSIRPENPAF